MSIRLTDKVLGRVGELLVEQQLIEHGWHPMRLDVAQFATSADAQPFRENSRFSLAMGS